MPTLLSTDDIVFMQKPSSSVFDEIFILKLFTGVTPQEPPSSEMPRPRDLTLLSLGFILVELMLGHGVFSQTGRLSTSNLDAYYSAVQNVLPDIRSESPNYFSAVCRCLDGELHDAKGKEDGNFVSKMYARVIKLLQQDLDML